MPIKRSVALSAFFLFVSILFTSNAAYACLGVSRTINVSSFNSALGMGAGGNIGLRHKEVVLTFDDGPIPGSTNRVLSALSRECTKATFFVVGQMARAYPSLLRKMARSGHTIAHHTQSHANLRNGSLAGAQREIQRGIRSTRTALGPLKRRSSKLFRYPYLARSASLDRVLRQNGLIPFSASVMSLDWKSRSSGEIVSRVMSQLSRQGRGVILMHDIHNRTASAVPELLRRLKRGGYKVVHIRSGGSGAPRGVNIASLSKQKSRRSRSAKRVKIDRSVTGSTPRKKFSLFSRTKSSRKTKNAYAPNKHLSRLERMKADSLRRSKLRKNSKKNAKKDKKKGSFFSRLRSKRKKGESEAAYKRRLKKAKKS